MRLQKIVLDQRPAILEIAAGKARDSIDRCAQILTVYDEKRYKVERKGSIEAQLWGRDFIGADGSQRLACKIVGDLCAKSPDYIEKLVGRYSDAKWASIFEQVDENEINAIRKKASVYLFGVKKEALREVLETIHGINLKYSESSQS